MTEGLVERRAGEKDAKMAEASHQHCCHHYSGCANTEEQVFGGKVGFPAACGGEQL